MNSAKEGSSPSIATKLSRAIVRVSHFSIVLCSLMLASQPPGPFTFPNISNYSGTPPYDHLINTTTSLIRPPHQYDHLVITANFFGPGKTLIHFLTKTPR